MATTRKRGDATKTSSMRKASRKLTLKKVTLRESAPARSVRGGAKMTTRESWNCGVSKD